MLKTSYNRGAHAALCRFKVAIDLPGTAPMGADYGVSPAGDEQSHGTDRTVYPPRRTSDGTSAAPAEGLPQDQFNTDWLWDISKYDALAPGATGEWGQEVVG